MVSDKIMYERFDMLGMGEEIDYGMINVIK